MPRERSLCPRRLYPLGKEPRGTRSEGRRRCVKSAPPGSKRAHADATQSRSNRSCTLMFDCDDHSVDPSWNKASVGAR